MVMLVAVTAFAGGNPNVKGYIDFDPPNRVHSYMPAAYETFNAYICFGDLDMGLAGCSFMINDVLLDCPGVFSPPILAASAASSFWTTLTILVGCSTATTPQRLTSTACCRTAVSVAVLAPRATAVFRLLRTTRGAASRLCTSSSQQGL